MRCFISYRRDNADTINGETLIVSQRYSTFNKAEMDRLEDYLKSSIGCGITVEYDIDKCIENEKEANDVVLQRIKDEIENLNCEYIDYNTGCSAYVSQNDVLQIINNHTKGVN